MFFREHAVVIGGAPGGLADVRILRPGVHGDIGPRSHAGGSFDVLGRYDEGKINSDTAFAQFLSKSLKGGESTSVARK